MNRHCDYFGNVLLSFVFVAMTTFMQVMIVFLIVALTFILGSAGSYAETMPYERAVMICRGEAAAAGAPAQPFVGGVGVLGLMANDIARENRENAVLYGCLARYGYMPVQR